MAAKVRFVALVVWAVSAFPAHSQQPTENSSGTGRAEVLVVGVYHMANPGRDIVNMQVDDVLAPKRQAEIAELVAFLRKFNPTKVAVEASFDNNAVARRYADYVAGKHTLSRNETEQIGFRLAKELGHKTIYQVDVDGEFPYARVVDYAKARGMTKEFEALMGEVSERGKATNAYLTSHTVLESILYMNADDRVAWDVGHYYRMAHLTEPWNWAGPDLLAEWFRRNIRIYGNIVRLIDSPRERILVIYGAGHTGWLQHNFASDPTVRLRKLAELR